jgi:hypothetical protein
MNVSSEDAAAPSAPAPAPGGQATAPAQAAEFLALAEKARQARAVYVKGSTSAEPAAASGPTAATRPTVNFEIWAQAPSARLKVDLPFAEVRVSDGEYVYVLTREAGEYQGQRRRITTANYYSLLNMAAFVCDAAGGYANLSSACKFVPAAPEPPLDKKAPPLKWFVLEPIGPRLQFMLGLASLKVGIGADDGLVRAVIGRADKSQGGWTQVITLEVVKVGQVKADDLLLPPEAASAKWKDRDTEQPLAAPAKLIAAGKP